MRAKLGLNLEVLPESVVKTGAIVRFVTVSAFKETPSSAMKKGTSPRLETIGARVRRLRTEQNLSQDRVALSANIDQSGFSKFERGVRSLTEDAVRRIADVLGVTFEELVTGTGFVSVPSRKRADETTG